MGEVTIAHKIGNQFGDVVGLGQKSAGSDVSKYNQKILRHWLLSAPRNEKNSTKNQVNRMNVPKHAVEGNFLAAFDTIENQPIKRSLYGAPLSLANDINVSILTLMGRLWRRIWSYMKNWIIFKIISFVTTWLIAIFISLL